MSKVSKEGQRNALLIMINFVWMFIVYRGCIFWTESVQSMLPYTICATVYMLAAVTLVCLYRYTGGNDDPKKKKLLAWAFPIIVCLIIDALDLVVVSYFIDLFSK